MMHKEQLLIVKFHKLYNSLPKNKNSQARILKIVSTENGISQRKLQEMVGIKPGSLSEVLLKLEKIGYITRVVDENDKRRQLVCITEEGRAAFNVIHKQHVEESEHIFDALSDEEKDQLLFLLNKTLGQNAHEKERFHENSSIS